MANGPFTPGNARIAADLFDFRKHTNGTDFLHSANHITTSPGVDGATNVQTSIDNINTFIASLSDLGTAFAAIPDGYDCYTDPAPNFYFSNAIPPLNDFLIPLFSAISTAGTMPTGYDRLKEGGILYIPAGTYYIDETVEIPPSIILLGEGYATKIINATSLDLTLSPPQIDAGATHVPMFIIKSDTNRSNNDSAIDAENSFMFSRTTKFVNITISDNFVEPTLLGDVYYKLPQNTIGDCPLIMQEQGSYLEMQDVKIIGRALATTKIISADGATRFAVKLDTVTSNTTGTMLKIINSFIDGFSLPISFNSEGGINDYLEVSGCKIRSHGYLDNDGASENKNCIINMNDNNSVIVSNFFYGNHNGCYTIAYITDVVSGGAPLVQDRSRILINSNNFTIDNGGATSVVAEPFIIDVGIGTLSDYASILVSNNIIDPENGFTISVADDIPQFEIFQDELNINSLGSVGIFGGSTGGNINIATIVNGGRITLNGALKVRTQTITSQPYAIDADGFSDYIIFVDLTTIAAATTITLPVPENGRTIIIKDRDGLADTYNITVEANSAELIEGLATDVIFSSSYGSWKFVSDGTNWFLS